MSAAREDNLSLAELRSANVARNAEWNTGAEQVSLAFRGNELAGEVGEACNVLKKLERERIGIRGSRATKDQAAEELADVVICVDLTAMDLGIDLGQAIRDKFNATSLKYGLATRLAAPTPPAAEAPGQEPVADGIERVGRGICLSYGEDPDDYASLLDICGPNNEPLLNWQKYEEQARAAILAMNRPAPDKQEPVAWIAKAEAQVAYWRQRQLTEKSLEDGTGADGEHTPIGDQAAWGAGYCNGRYSEADWWLKTLTVSAPPTYADAEAKGFAFKPLEWIDHTKGEGCPQRRLARLPFGRLVIFQAGSEDAWYVGWDGRDGKFAGRTEAEAKAAAQADFERRIRSLASPAPKGET